MGFLRFGIGETCEEMERRNYRGGSRFILVAAARSAFDVCPLCIAKIEGLSAPRVNSKLRHNFDTFIWRSEECVYRTFAWKRTHC